MRRVLILRDPGAGEGSGGGGAAGGATTASPALSGSLAVPSGGRDLPLDAPPIDKTTTGDMPDIDLDAEVKFSDGDFDDQDMSKPVTKARTAPQHSEPSKQEPTQPAKEPSFDLELESDKKTEPGLPQSPQLTPAQKQTRNYDGLDEEVRALLSELHNNPYNKYREVLPKWYEAYKKLPELNTQLQTAKQAPSWIEHPRAYELDDAYVKSQETLQLAQFENDFYTRQLQAIENGEKWQRVEGYDKNGQPVVRTYEPLENGKIDVRARAFVMGALSQLSGISREAQQQAESVRATFAQRMKTQEQELLAFEDKVFKDFKDVNSLAEEDKKMFEDIKNLYPAAVRNSLPVRHVAKSYLAFQKLARKAMTIAQERDAFKKQLDDLKARHDFARRVTGDPANGDPARIRDEEEIDLKKLDETFND